MVSFHVCSSVDRPQALEIAASDKLFCLAWPNVKLKKHFTGRSWMGRGPPVFVVFSVSY